MSGQKIGWRPYTAPSTNTVSTLLTSLYGAWNGDTTGTSLDASIFGAWNGETTTTVTTLNGSVSSAWNGDNFYSTSGITASNVNNVTLSTGKIGNAFTFNGSNYVSLPASVMNFTGDFTVNFWIKINSTAVSNQGIMGNKRWGLGPGGFEIIFNGGWLQALGGNQQNGASGFATNGNLTLANATTWTMVTFIYRKGVSNSFYINAGTSYTTAHQHTLESSIFNGQLGSEPMDNYRLNGNLDAVTFWDRAITQNEIYALYNSTNGREYPYPSTISVDIPSPNDAVGTNHGTLMNGASFTTGKIGNAFTFDGVNDYVELPANSMNVTGDFTISFWANMRTRDYNNIICNMGNDGVNRGFYIDSDGSYALRFVGYNSGYTLVKTDNSVLFDMNVWNHYTFICKNGVGQWYKNGVANGSSGSIVYSLISGNKPIIGGYRTGNSGSVSSNKNMALDAITIWNKAITLDEITQLYNLGTGAQYPFSSQTLPSTMNQLGIDNATLMNGCSLTTGKIGQAFTFDGVNDYVALPDNSFNFTGDFSVSAWIYVSNLSGEKYIISNSNGNIFDVNTGWCFGVFDNKVSFWVYPGTSSFTGWLTNTTLSLNTWYHVSVTKKPSQSPLLYINGVLSSTSLYNNTMSNSLNPVYYTTTYPNTKASIGVYRYNNGSSAYAYWNGKIDTINVWQKELTQAEVIELYNSGAGKQITTTPIVTNGLVLNLDASRTSSYPGSGTTWTDISGSGNNGTMVNGPVFGTASGGVITFDGVNDYIDLGTKTTLAPGTTDFTISFWINPNNWGSLSSTSYSPIFVTLVNGGLWIGKNGANFVLRTAYIADDVQYSVLPTVNQWTMVTVNRVGNIAKIYYNGSAVASVTVTRNYVSGNSYLANDIPSNGNFSNIKLSTFYYYNRGLSELEITQNFNATKSRFGL